MLELLVPAVIQVESAGREEAVSRCGAAGLMQLMPETGREWHSILVARGDIAGDYDPFNAEQNTKIGAAYLEWLWKQFGGDVRLTLAAYNCGIGRVRSAQRAAQAIHWDDIKARLPKETQDYVPKVLNACAALAHLQGLTLASYTSAMSARPKV